MWTDDEIREMLRLQAAGKSYSDIGRRLNRSRSTICAKMSRVRQHKERERRKGQAKQEVRAILRTQQERKKPSLPPVSWISRPHPCPDIEDRIKELKAQEGRA